MAIIISRLDCSMIRLSVMYRPLLDHPMVNGLRHQRIVRARFSESLMPLILGSAWMTLRPPSVRRNLPAFGVIKMSSIDRNLASWARMRRASFGEGRRIDPAREKSLSDEDGLHVSVPPDRDADHSAKAGGQRVGRNRTLLHTDVARGIDGGAEGSRTPDLRNAIAALSQLSYGPGGYATSYVTD